MTKITVAGLSLALVAVSAEAQPAGGKPAIVGSPAIVLDLQATNGSAAVDLRNDLAEPVALHLSVWPVQDHGLGVSATIKGQADTATGFEITIKPRSAERIWITVSGAGADDFDLDLLNGADRIGRIPVKHRTFSVHPTDPKAV